MPTVPTVEADGAYAVSVTAGIFSCTVSTGCEYTGAVSGTGTWHQEIVKMSFQRVGFEHFQGPGPEVAKMNPQRP